MEQQAADLLKKGEWALALKLYTSLLQKENNSQQQILNYLQDRADCLFYLGHHEIIVNDSKEILTSFSGKQEYTYRTRIQMIRSLYVLNKIADAECVVKDWLMIVKQLNDFGEAKMVLENLLERFFSLSSKQTFEIWLNTLEQNFGNTNLFKKNSANVFCIYCNTGFKEKSDLMSHCLTQEHEAMIMSDDGHDWYWRPPPRGIKAEAYDICENWKETGTCRFGIQCIDAHGTAELQEWKERFNYREMKLLRAREKELYGKRKL